MVNEHFLVRVSDTEAAHVLFPLALAAEQRDAFMARVPAKAVAQAPRMAYDWRAVEAAVEAQRKAGDDVNPAPARYVPAPSPFDGLYAEPAPTPAAPVPVAIATEEE